MPTLDAAKIRAASHKAACEPHDGAASVTVFDRMARRDKPNDYTLHADNTWTQRRYPQPV